MLGINTVISQLETHFKKITIEIELTCNPVKTQNSIGNKKMTFKGH